MADKTPRAKPTADRLATSAEEWPPVRLEASKAGFIHYLAAELGVSDPAIQSNLWSAVAFSAQWLFVDQTNRPDAKTLRRRLGQIEGHANRLLEALQKPAEGLQGRPGLIPATDIDGWLWHLLSRAEQHSAPATLESTQQQLQTFLALVAATKETLSETGPGRRKDGTLWSWVEHLTPIWSLYFQQPVTVDYHNGQPITPYTRFMHRAIQVLDANRENKLPSVLDRYRTQQNQAKPDPNIPE